MHDRLFATPHHLSLPELTQHAQAMGLDMNRFHAEMADHIYTQRVQEHRRAAEVSDVHTTPTFILNGKRVDVSGGFGALEAAARAAARSVG
jgi:predicted DsbA family dithiol-disulfide isomerase